MDKQIQYSSVLSDKEAVVHDEMLRKGASIIDEFQKEVTLPEEDSLSVHFMARTGKYEALEHIADVRKLTFRNVEDDTEVVLCLVDINSVHYGEYTEQHEHSCCFKATFHNLMGYGSELDARCYFGSEEWLNDYVIKPFQEKREMYWDKYKA